jgi:hypothetical protein
VNPASLSDPAARWETFSALGSIGGIRHAFTQRAPGVDVAVDRPLALSRLDAAHGAIRRELGLAEKFFATAEQVHGADVAVVDSRTRECIPNVDGLLTSDPAVCLGIYVADCCAIYLVDPVRRALGLLHSGRRGTEQGIATVAITRMAEEFGTVPTDLIVQLSPCIRPPHYEVDIASQIVAQCRAAGVRRVHDCGVCTGCHVERYYSYRRELGKTGRMLALLALHPAA